jgi:hypothetical protein
MQQVLFTLFAIWFVVPATANAQEPDPFGFDFTNFLCEQVGLQTVALADAKRTPKDSVLILVGHGADVFSSDLAKFVNNGGAVLFATDQHSRRSRLFKLRQGPHQISDRDQWYQGHSDCFRVPVLEHEITRGVKEIIVNRAGGIERRSTSFRRLANLPESRYGLLEVYDGTPGRLVLLSDHSPFTNDMLMHGDNAILTVNIINWLSEGRSKVSFIADATQLGGANLPPMLPPDEMPPIDPDDIPNDTKMAIANRFLKEVERDNLFNRFLKKIPDYMVWRWIIILPTMLMAFILFRRLLRRRSVIKPPELHAANGSEARALTMIRTQTLRPAAQELAKDLMRTLTGSGHLTRAWTLSRRDVWVSPGVGESPKRVQADVQKMSEIATGSDRRRRMKPRELTKLAARIEELKFLHSTGQLRLRPETATT